MIKNNKKKIIKFKIEITKGVSWGIMMWGNRLIKAIIWHKTRNKE